jgi:adenylate cyclase
MRIPLPMRSLTLSVTLATLIGFLVTLAVLIVLALEWLTGSRITVDLLDDRARLALSALEARVRAHLDPAHDQVTFLARLIAERRLDPTDRTATRATLLGAMAGTPQIQLLGMVDEDLHMLGAERRGPDIETIDRPLNPAAIAEYRATVARPESDAYWAEPIFVAAAKVSALDIRQRLTREGRAVGALVATVSIVELSHFLDTLDDERRELHTFVLYGHDRVAAHSAMAKVLSRLSPEHPLPSLDEVDDPVLAAIWRKPRPFLSVLPGVDMHVATVSGRRWLFLVRDVSGYGREPLMVGFYIPVDRVDQALRRLSWSGFAGLGILVLSLAASVALGRALARPIRRVAKQSSLVGSLELSQVSPLAGSFIRELNDQSRAFNAMLSSLRWFETYVPKVLVRRLIARGDPAGIDTVERTLTIMFTDIVGFTPAAERMTPQGTADFLNRHLALVNRCIEAEHGTVDKFIGDAVMAFWGAPEEQRDHADRACRAALAIRAAIHADNRRRSALGEGIVRLRIGIHTGRVVVGNIGSPGRMNYTVVGDAVNAAQRLESLGKEIGSGDAEVAILVSGATLGAATAPLATSFAGTFNVKGRAEGIEVHQLD